MSVATRWVWQFARLYSYPRFPFDGRRERDGPGAPLSVDGDVWILSWGGVRGVQAGRFGSVGRGERRGEQREHGLFRLRLRLEV
jgi:hypothetical protein